MEGNEEPLDDKNFMDNVIQKYSLTKKNKRKTKDPIAEIRTTKNKAKRIFQRGISSDTNKTINVSQCSNSVISMLARNQNPLFKQYKILKVLQSSLYEKRFLVEHKETGIERSMKVMQKSLFLRTSNTGT